MHKKIKELIEHAIDVLRTKTAEKFPVKSEQIFKEVISELAKIKHDNGDSRGHKFYKEATSSIYLLTSIQDMDWGEALGDIGFTLDGRHPTISEIVSAEYSDDNKAAEFFIAQTEELYQQLIGLCE